MKLSTYLVAILSTASLQAAETIISKGSSDWNMLHITDGVDPANSDSDFHATWFNPTVGGYIGGSYDGPSFTSNQTTPFRYGTVSGLVDATVLTAPASGDRYTSYFYKIVDGGTGFRELKISMLADDGAFIYLNGQLIARDGFDDNDSDTFTSLSSLGGEYLYDNIPVIGNPVLKPGLNLIAISLHQQAADSSDLGFDLEITGDPILSTTTSSDWAMLSPIDGSSNGYNPATGDSDFNSTWHSQSLGSYTGVPYDGPAFTTGHQAPFLYGGIDGIGTPNTNIPAPSEGTRGSAYFLKEIDGGSEGYPFFGIDMLADDGAYIYLNGTLIGVAGDLPNSAASDTWDQYTSVPGSESETTTVTLIGNPQILPGANLLAVSLHQFNDSSSDLGFSLELYTKTILSPTITREPYLQSGSHDRMTVRWRTDELCDTILRYGSAPDALTQTISMSEYVHDHIVTITGLSPSTTYYYQVESNNQVGKITAGAIDEFYFKTYPVNGEKAPARIWVIGDSGTNSTAKHNVYDRYLDYTGTTHTDAWLMLGDNAYNSGTDSEFQVGVFDSYKELLRNTVMWSCIGNHEAYTDSGAPYIDIHSFPTLGQCGGIPSGSERYYSFDHGNIHFVCIDSETSGNYNSTPSDEPISDPNMVDWLKMDLQATDKDWIIAYFHHGPYTKGSHDSDSSSHHIKVRQYITPLLEKYGCDLVLSGHSHCYERSMLINGHHSNFSSASSTSASFNPATHIINGGNGSTVGSVDSSGDFSNSGADGAYQKPLATGEAGTVYTICGASGKLSSWDNDSDAIVNPEPHPVFIVNLRVMGSMVIDINGNSLNAKYIDQNGDIRDDFTILKGSTYQVASTDTSFAEEGSDSASITVTRSGATSLPETISYALSGKTTNGVDYSPLLNNSLSFIEDQTSIDINLTPLADNLAEGDETFTFTLSPQTQTTADSSTLRDRYFLNSSNELSLTLKDSPSQLWWFNQNGASGETEVTEAEWNSDADGDGLNQMLEYAFGGDVGTNNSDLLPQIEFVDGNVVLTYNKNNALNDVTYQVYQSSDLINWNLEGVVDSLNGPANPTGIESRKATIPLSGDTEKFLRLEVEKP